MINWIKNKIMWLSLALYNVEKNALSQKGESLSDDVGTVQRHRQGMLSDSLLHGEVTEEVKLLRHRMYKILDESSKIKAMFKKDANGNITYELINKGLTPTRVKGDPSDTYKVELVIDNTGITDGANLTSEHPDDVIIDNPIVCTRKGITPKFKIESYSNRLYVRYIEEDLRLLEFYIPKYVDQYNRKTTFLISELKKLLAAPKYSDVLDIQSVAFITFNAIGSQDFREFIYNIIKFDKIVEYDGSYIIKFIAKVITNGDNIIDKYKHEGQEKRYANKEARC